MRQTGSGAAVSKWTLIQVVSILIWVSGFVIAFYFVTWGAQSTNILGVRFNKQGGQVAGMILTGFAYLAIIFSMIKHSPDRER